MRFEERRMISLGFWDVGNEAWERGLFGLGLRIATATFGVGSIYLN